MDVQVAVLAGIWINVYNNQNILGWRIFRFINHQNISGNRSHSSGGDCPEDKEWKGKCIRENTNIQDQANKGEYTKEMERKQAEKWKGSQERLPSENLGYKRQ